MMRNPVFESSMKRRMRTFRAPLLLTLYGAFLILVSAGALVTLSSPSVTVGNLRAGLETYIYLSVMQFFLIVLVAPALTAGSIAGERERQTLDLLLCTRTGALRIVTGKLFSAACYLTLLIVSSLPMMGLVFLFGGVSLGAVLTMLAFLIVTAVACCSIGLFCSAVFKRTVTATVVAYLIVFGLGVCTVALPLLLQYDTITSAAYRTVSGAGTSSVWEMFRVTPKMFYLNPALGLLSLLVEQTGLLQSTFYEMGGYRGDTLFSLFRATGATAVINIIVLLGCSVILTGLSALFVRPSGRKAKKS